MVLMTALFLSGCVKSELPSAGAAGSKSTGDVVLSMDEVADSIDIIFAMGNNARTMTYQQSTPLTLPDGKVVTQGELKPTWQYISSELGFAIQDKTVQDQKATEMVDISAATSFSQATIFGGNSIANDLMDYGAQGYFINLKDYMDLMPDVKAYLEANPNVAKAITAYDGGIYHLPYVAEIDNYARVYCARPSWVKLLLDGGSLEQETESLSVSYPGYWDRYDSNVIDLQNEAAAGGALDRDSALSVLKAYIAETHPGLEKPSDLYLGSSAVYDIDELIALWRVIKLSPNTLSKAVTGSVVPNAIISPYFVRKSDYRDDLLRMINYFDGETVHASDSYEARLYIDGKGDMSYSYADEDFLSKLEYVRDWYAEGLIHSEFADKSVKTEFRKTMYFSDDVPGQRQFGFMTFDWIASTTKGNDDVLVVLPPVTTISDAGINDFVHFVENSRVIKPDGWSISARASEGERNAAILLFNYMFTEAGNQVQNYSIPQIVEENEKFMGPDGTEYAKFKPWIFDAAGEYKSGDVSGFLRDFMGSHLPLGYQKEIGFELQYTSESGFESWDIYTQAGVITRSYNSEYPALVLMPPAISLNDQQVARIGRTAVSDQQVEKIFVYIVGGDTAVGGAAELRRLYEEAGIEDYIRVYKDAYDRMMADS